MRTFFLLYLILILSFVSCSHNSNSVQKAGNPRILITTDIGGDPDDQQSMIRLLLYSNQLDIEGLVASSSGTPNELKNDTIKPGLIMEIIDAYSLVQSNLLLHSDGFPDASDLRSVVKKGNKHRGIDFIGEGHNTEGSDYIIECGDREDDRKLNISIWGGQTDLAQALWKVKNERSTEEYNRFIQKLRIYDIADQDGLYSHIRKNHPDLFYVLARAPEGIDKREAVFRGMYLGGDEYLTSGEWIEEHVKNEHGPLGALYPMETWTAPNPHGVMKEGDTPSWFYFLANGMQSPDNPNYGGWGGRFKMDSANYYIDAQDQVNGVKNARATVFRWRKYFQNDFATRMDWCIQSFDDANHPPVLFIDGESGNYPLEIGIKPGEELQLSASDSSDPDGDQLSFLWWVYEEPARNSLSSKPLLSEKKELSVVIPVEAISGKYHIICEVTDSGIPALTSFRRIVLKVGGK